MRMEWQRVAKEASQPRYNERARGDARDSYSEAISKVFSKNIASDIVTRVEWTFYLNAAKTKEEEREREKERKSELLRL